ncbi:MAG: hypothetical protein QOH34_3738 [Mycobacterium sp.]|jgi:hypothetical protein|nr:hypothetical protein [Mycobacterium sp.]
MYGRVANTDSEVVFLGFALDHRWRSLADGSASARSTFVASTGSTTVHPARSVTGPVLRIARLLHLSESGRTHSSHWPSPLRQSALAQSCPRNIVNCQIPIAQPSEGTSSARLHAEFSTAGTDQGDGLIESVIPLQILARNLALALGCGVDRPRKLTKSVAVA